MPRALVVPRTALLERLLTSTSPVIALMAPPGYGKTTLLAQWVEVIGPRIAWVTCDKTDDDPAALWSAVATAIDAVAPLGPTPSRLLAASGGGIDVVPAFVAAIETAGAPMTIVLDRLEVISSSASRAAIAEFAMRVPPGWQLALASREALPVPTARLRAHGRITEVGMPELAMSPVEAASMLAGVGVDASLELTDDLLQMTEGWPAGLYLAALAARTGEAIAESPVRGDDRWIGDYLRAELTSRATPEEMSFLLRTSILDRLSGPLCDTVAQVRGSAAHAGGSRPSKHARAPARPSSGVVSVSPPASRTPARRTSRASG